MLSQSIDDDFDLKERFKTNKLNKIENVSDDDSVSCDLTSFSEPMIDINKFKILKKKKKIFHSKLINFFFLLISIAFLLIILFVFGLDQFVIKSFKSIRFPAFLNYKNQKIDNNEWSFSLNSFGTESCIRLYDIDEDGLDDLIFGLVGNTMLKPLLGKQNTFLKRK